MATYTEIESLLESVEVCDQSTAVVEHNLQNIFEKKCVFKISPEEVKRIQTLTETFVRKLLERVENSQSYKMVLESIQCPFSFYSSNSIESSLLKVGSFYEKTKNNFPDEFDFIYLIGECRMSVCEQMKVEICRLSDEFHFVLQQTVDTDESIQNIRYKGIHGPANKLGLTIPAEENNSAREISVDISVACRVRLDANFPTELTTRFIGWENIIRETGSFLLLKVYKDDHPKHKTSVQIAVTEAEQNYMLTKMSAKHKRVYRLLKVLINGNDGNEELKHLIKHLDNRSEVRMKDIPKVQGPNIVCDFPSYAVKNLIYFHEQFCKDDKDGLSVCTLQILGHILQKFQVELVRLSKFNCMNFMPYLRTTSVKIEKVVGEPLEIADEYESAAKLAESLVDLTDGLQGNIKLEDVSVTSRARDLVKDVVKRQKEGFMGRCLCITLWLTLFLGLAALIAYVYISIHADHVCTYRNNNIFNTSDLMLYTLECVEVHPSNGSLPCSCLQLSLGQIADVPSELKLSCYSAFNESGTGYFSLEYVSGKDVLICPSDIFSKTMNPGCFRHSDGKIGSWTVQHSFICEVLACPANFTLGPDTYRKGTNMCCVVTGQYSADEIDDCLNFQTIAGFSQSLKLVLAISHMCVIVIVVRYVCYRRRQIQRVSTIRDRIAAGLDAIHRLTEQ